MIKGQLFDLEKIKNLTTPIEELQLNLNKLTETFKELEKNIQIVKHEFKLNNEYLSQIKLIEKLLKKVNVNLNKVSKSNLNRFLDFQDRLIAKYKENFKDRLKKLKINEETIKKLGLSLIEEKKISKIINFVSFIPSIDITHWILLLDSLKFNSLFLKVVKRVQVFYQNIQKMKLNVELSKISNGTDPKLIEDYKEYFEKNSNLTFNDFLKIVENKLTQQELKVKTEIIKRAKEKKEIEKLKQKQEEQKDSYENYLKLSDKEFERLRRRKNREKLNISITESKEKKEIELSEEISEKIKKFKSQFEKSFEEKYMIQKDEEQDPIDLIRARKKRKEEEYKEYEDHFEN